MADNGNREPTETYRRAGGKKRREPPIIDASATEVPVEPASPVVVPDEPVSAEPAEPVLFGSAMRDPVQRSREAAVDAALPELPNADETVAEPPAGASGLGLESEAESPALSRDPSEPEGPPTSRADSVPPGFEAPARPMTGLVPGLLGLVVLVLLGTVAWLLFAGPQRGGRDEIAGSVADLQANVAAL